MADGMAFAMIVEDPDTTCVLEHGGICWPYKSQARARETARKLGLPGIWRVKPRANV
jgi:hypothetical protein